jgi:gluconate 2-dehydrogenase gamma chain
VTVDRRSFCALIAAGCPALGLLGCKRNGAPPSTVPTPCVVEHRTAANGRVLTQPEWTTLEAACARIIPTDDDPGATEANVVNYIDAQLSMPHFKSFRHTFSDGLKELDRLASGGTFVSLPAAKQDQILTRMERGVRMGRRRSSRQFFRLLLTFSLEGYLSDPVYGGNRDQAGWRFIGFEVRPPRPRCPYLGWKNSSQTS